MINKADIDFTDHFQNKCKANNLKITPQRRAIYSEIVKAKNHPSVSAIFKEIRKIFPDISFDTVNRTLLTFNEIGIVSLVEGYGEPKRFDPDTKTHHHFRCTKCSDIIDIHHKSFDNIRIPQDIQKRFTVLNKKVVLEGVCERCGKKRR
jgi:Fur family transcriptional regulator, peroxide stress response regulator